MCIAFLKCRCNLLTPCSLRTIRILSPNQRDFILRTGVENGGQAEWDFAFDQYQKASGNGDFLRAISATRMTNIIYS
jgi:aminopeptidase N